MRASWSTKAAPSPRKTRRAACGGTGGRRARGTAAARVRSVLARDLLRATRRRSGRGARVAMDVETGRRRRLGGGRDAVPPCMGYAAGAPKRGVSWRHARRRDVSARGNGWGLVWLVRWLLWRSVVWVCHSVSSPAITPSSHEQVQKQAVLIRSSQLGRTVK